jgi:hypothetical protein
MGTETKKAIALLAIMTWFGLIAWVFSFEVAVIYALALMYVDNPPKPVKEGK